MTSLSAWENNVAQASGERRFDLELRLDAPEPAERLLQLVGAVAAVRRVEPWSLAPATLAGAGAMRLASGDYKLVQFHFHTPSEESIDGKRFPLVAHLVHKNENGALAVVAVLFKKGKENAALKQVFAELPAAAGDKHPLASNIDMMATLPSTHAYYAYMGSLTTPPCSEGVHWQVLKQPSEISGKQLAAFRKLYPMNARPVQPLNGRIIDFGG